MSWGELFYLQSILIGLKINTIPSTADRDDGFYYWTEATYNYINNVGE